MCAGVCLRVRGRGRVESLLCYAKNNNFKCAARFVVVMSVRYAMMTIDRVQFEWIHT